MKIVNTLVVMYALQVGHIATASGKLTVKNKSAQDIECTIYMTGGLKDVKVKEVHAGKAEHFTVDATTLEGLGWKMISGTNRACKDWFRLSNKSEVIKSMIAAMATKKDVTVVIKDGGSIEASTSKELLRSEIVPVFGQVCGNK